MNWTLHKKAMAQLKRLGVGGYVVMSDYAGRNGIDVRFPIGEIVGFKDPITVRVKRIGLRTTIGYAA